MKVTRLPDVERAAERSVAVGTFDGVHLGHREVIAGSDSVLTFDPHPVSVVAPQHTPEAADDARAQGRADRLAGRAGDDRDPVRRASSRSARPSEFIDDVLVGALGATQVAIGENFRFGHRRRATRGCCAPTSASTTVVHPLLEVDGEIVSSSHIRGLAAGRRRGRGQPPARLAPSSSRGEVAHGDERGRELGFPTANLVPDEALACPGHGVYACLADGAEPRPAAVSIGVRPTFKTGRGELIEAYLLDFDGDLYGQTLRLEFLERLRGERRFDSAEALVEQMHRDVAAHARDRRAQPA